MTTGLVKEWKQAWRWLSVQLGAVIAVSHEIYEQVSAMKEYLPQPVFNHIMALLGVLVIIGRIKKQ